MNNLQNNTKRVILSVLGVALLIGGVFGVSIAFFNYTRTGSPNTLRTGRIYFNSTQNNTLNITNVFPMTSTQASTANLDAVTINVEGDTEYTNGIEYLITIDQVNDTINGKQIPINFIAEVSNTGNIGASSNDYWNARETKTSSIYELTSSGKAKNGQYVLVGYIKSGATGITGSITIKAYLDASRIAISDTLENGPIVETGYVNGTTSTWVNGRTVLTTSEWNSLQGSGALSFKIKAEANEGIWVEEPGRIETCPNCKFIYTTNELWTTWNTDSQTPTELTSGYSTNYNDVVTSSGENYFLGVVTNGSNQITKAYACGLKDGTTPFCIEGTSDGSNYSSNSSFINGASLWNNTCTITGYPEYTRCGSWDDSSVSADADSDGYVYAGVSSHVSCIVDPIGRAYCSESFPGASSEPGGGAQQ